jgi:hypothetical protein
MLRYSSKESLLLLPLALECHAPDALGVINKAQLLVQTNNLVAEVTASGAAKQLVTPIHNYEWITARAAWKRQGHCRLADSNSSQAGSSLQMPAAMNWHVTVADPTHQHGTRTLLTCGSA